MVKKFRNFSLVVGIDTFRRIFQPIEKISENDDFFFQFIGVVSYVLFRVYCLGKKKKPYFGTSLIDIMAETPTKSGIPFPVEKCIEYLEKIGPKFEGIYRVSGSFKNVNEIAVMFNDRKEVKLEAYDKYVVTGVIKKYFASLPEPLMTWSLYSKFMQAQCILSLFR